MDYCRYIEVNSTFTNRVALPYLQVYAENAENKFTNIYNKILRQRIISAKNK